MSHSWAGDPSTQDYSSTTDAKSAEEIERKAFDAWYMDHFSKPRQWAGTREELFNAWQARAALAIQPPAVQGEPVAWRYSVQPQVLGPSKWVFSETKDTPDAQPLCVCTPSREVEPLTDDAILDAFCHTPGIHQFVQAFKAGARFAERAHGIHSRGEGES